jgi:hypothetical protein
MKFDDHSIQSIPIDLIAIFIYFNFLIYIYILRVRCNHKVLICLYFILFHFLYH